MSPHVSRSGRMALAIAAVMLAAFAVPTYVVYRRDVGRAYARVETGSRIAQTRCGPIEYAVAGEGPPVLVVHGAGGGFDQGLELGTGLARGGYQVIAMSRFGYLRTPVPANASAEAQADAHACLLDALNIPRAAIVGISAGGPSTLQFALRHPDRTTAVVLLVPGVYAPVSDSARPGRMSPVMAFVFETTLRSDFAFWAGSKIAPRKYIRSVLGTPPELLAHAPPGEEARLRLVIAQILPVKPRRLGLINDAAVVSSQPRYDLERIGAPTLAISAADDLYGTFDAARYTAAHMPRARFVAYATGGHMLVGHDAETAGEISAFLATYIKKR